MAMDRRRRLNAFDQCMLSVGDVMQWLGNAGFETLAVLWLEGPLVEDRLRAAVDELARRHPVLTARLTKHWTRHDWDWSAGHAIPIRRSTLPAIDDDAINAAAAEILGRRRDLRTEPPLELHVLGGPDGDELLFLHANHALLDHGAATRVLVELSALLAGDPLPPPAEPFDAIAEYRSRFGRLTRWGALRRLVPEFVHDRWGKRSRILPNPPTYDPIDRKPVRVVTRTLSGDDLAELNRRVRASKGLPSPSMSILGSVFRTFAALVSDPREDDVFRTGIGVEVDRQRPERFHPQNLSSLLRVEASRGEVEGDPTELADLLGQRLLAAMKQKRDLGIVEANSMFGWNYPLVSRIAGAAIRWAFSLWYAYFAAPRELSETFGGVPLRGLRYLGPAWSPPGLTLLATRFRDDLHFSLSYVEGPIAGESARALLDGVARDLVTALSDVPQEQRAIP